MAGAVFDFSGVRIGRLVAISSAGIKNRRSRWHCQCDCGKQVVVMSQALRSGHTQSCGCLALERQRQKGKNSTHGASGTRTHAIWCGIRRRCTNQRDEAFHNYGGRGISICERWSSFASFLEDMGECPAGYEIDRIDVNGNYEPGNCRWATLTEQANNKRNNRIVEHDGHKITVAQFAKLAGLKYGTAYYRLVIRGNSEHRN